MTAPRAHPATGDGPGEHDDSWSWREVAPWVLVLSTAVPVLIAAETARRVLTGTLDAVYLGFAAEGDDAGPGFAARYDLLQQFADVQSGLLAAGTGSALLAGVALAGRPGWLVPHGAARWAALATAAVSALAGLAMLVAVLARASVGAGEPQFYLRNDLFVSLGPVSGVAVFTLGASALSAVALARSGNRPAPPHPAVGTDGDVDTDTDGGAVGGADGGADGDTTGEVTAPPPGDPQRARPRPSPGEEPEGRPGARPAAPAAVPRMPEDHAAFYRRPGA